MWCLILINASSHFFQAVLASTIIVALYGMFKQVKDVHKYYKLCIPDMVRTYVLPYSGKISRTINFAVFEDFTTFLV